MGKYEMIAPANSFDRWPEGLRQDLQANAMNPMVGSVLVSETDELRVWHLLVPAGQRCSFHRHVLDYFWTCHSHGRARGYYEDGSITETTHYPGDTMHLSYGAGEYLLHSVENIGDSDLLHIPIGLKAGFGELGRHGSIIHPTLGPLFRMGSVATTVALAIDHPIDAGIGAFCDTCLACRKYCPADAIPDQRSPAAGPDHLGHDRYVVDTGRCFPYFAKHNYCSICLPVCVYNHKEWARDFEGFKTKLFPTVVMDDPPPASDLPESRKRHWYPLIKR